MNTQKTIKGLWWVFGKEKDPVIGKLTYDPEEGAELHFEKSIYQMPSLVAIAFDWQRNFPRIVYGEEPSGRAITLMGCTCRNWRIDGGLGSFEIDPLIVLVGESLKSWDVAQYDAVRFRLTLLDQWLNRDQFLMEINDGLKMRVQMQNLDEIRADLPPDAKVKISPQIETKKEIGDLRIQIHHSIEVRLAKPLGPEAIAVQYIEVFRRMLMLCTSVEVFPEDIELLPAGKNEKWIEFFQPTPGIKGAVRTRGQTRMALRFEELSQTFPTFLRSWFEYNERLSSVLGLYFGCVYNGTLYGSQKFLFLAQALEVYHRHNSNFEGSEQNTQEWTSRLERVLNSVVVDEREWLRKRLEFANEKTLSKRLLELLSAHSAEIRDIIPDSQEFASKVRHTRNFFTHYDPKLERRRKVANDTQLNRLCSQMETFLGLCILKDLKITGDPIERLIERYKSLRVISADGSE